MISKGMYVHSRSGRFGHRSICYLACGRPVIAQDTGLGDAYPVGTGLLTFGTPQEAARAVRRVLEDPAAHGEAARAIAERHFDAIEVVGAMLDTAGVPV